MTRICSPFSLSSIRTHHQQIKLFNSELGIHSELSLVPWWLILAVTLNKQAQKTMDYYKMFRMNAQGDVHSTRNKDRLSQSRTHGMLCVGPLFWEMSGQERRAGNRVWYGLFSTVRKLGQNFDKKSCRKPNHTKIGARW